MHSLGEFALYLLGLFLQTQCWYENPGRPWEPASWFMQDLEGLEVLWSLHGLTSNSSAVLQ